MPTNQLTLLGVVPTKDIRTTKAYAMSVVDGTW
jgi:hypothetical protein